MKTRATGLGRLRRSARATLLGLSLASAAGCGAPTPGPNTPPPNAGTVGAKPAPGAPSGTTAGGSRLGRVYSSRFRISIPLPDRDSWALDRHKSSFLVLTDKRSTSQLVVREWLEDENMNRDECERRARLRRDFPPRVVSEVIVRRPVAVPPEFDTVAEVGLLTGGRGGAIQGYVMAFGGWARRCFAYVYTTEAAGAGAEQRIADRLAVIQGRSLPGVELRRDTDPIEVRGEIDLQELP